MSIAIKAENLSKAYQLGEIGTGTISRDLERWFAKVRGKEDPFLKIGEANDRTQKGTSDIVWSLKDINFEIEQGDAVGIIGRNGAGKSTLLKVLSRVTSPTSGRISGKGRIASLLEVGTGFHPELTGRENIYLNGAILGMRKKEIKRKFDEIVDFAGVDRYIDTPVKRYSSGMYVRLAFAVAAHLESEILIVDEVLAVGDAEFQRKCLGKMNDVSKGEGRTVLFVSHNMLSIRNLCNRSLLMQNGSLSDFADTDQIVTKYLMENYIDRTNLSLEKVKRTHGRGPFIKKAWIESCNNEKKNSINFGENFYIIFEFLANEKILNPNFGIGIENSEGQRIFSINNEIIGKNFNNTKTGKVFFEIKNPNFKPGEYFISLSLVQNNNEWIDYVERAIRFTISDFDFFGTGKVLTNDQGYIFLQTNIELKN